MVLKETVYNISPKFSVLCVLLVYSCWFCREGNSGPTAHSLRFMRKICRLIIAKIFSLSVTNKSICWCSCTVKLYKLTSIIVETHVFSIVNRGKNAHVMFILNSFSLFKNSIGYSKCHSNVSLKKWSCFEIRRISSLELYPRCIK